MADDTQVVDSWTRRVNVYGAIGVTIFIFGLFLTGMVVTAKSHDQSAFNALLETIKALTMVAAGYWIGTSHNSTKKDEIIARSNEIIATNNTTTRDGDH